MPEDFEDQRSEPMDIQKYVDVIRRRHLAFLTALLLVWAAVWGTSWILPPTYKSGTLILVEAPTMPKAYVTPNVNDDLQDRLQNITQQILSRTRLLLIIDKFDLYADNHSHLTPDEKVEDMRKDIDIKLVRDRGEAVTAFNIYYSAHSPEIAQQVTSELARLFINQNLEVRQQQSEDTTMFLKDQLETARQSLAEQDAKIQAFKGLHEGDLPGQQATNLQILSGLQSQLENEEGALNTAQQQKVYLQTLINQSRTLQGTSRTSDGVPVGLTAIDQQLETLNARLTELSTHYTDQYPDIENLKSQIAKTERIRDELSAALRKGAHNGSQPSGAAVSHDLAGLAPNSPMLQLQGQFQAEQAEITNREQSIASLKSRISDYQARLNDEPATEQKLTDLTRGYDQSKANYDDLLRKESDSQMATSMEKMQQGERFRTLDPPSLPLKPDFPNRLKFCGMGLGAGLALALVVAIGLEVVDDRLHSESAIKGLLPMKVMAEIPEVLNPSDVRSNRRRMFLGWAFAALVFTSVLAGSAFSYLHS